MPWRQRSERASMHWGLHRLWAWWNKGHKLHAHTVLLEFVAKKTTLTFCKRALCTLTIVYFQEAWPENLVPIAKPHKKDFRFLGMKIGSNTDTYMDGKCSLPKLSCELRQVQHMILKTSQTLPVVQVILDQYLPSGIASDHLLAGIGKG